jgi:3-deoxy-D-arabino-heptulosonate 7-phosphate (DAHP) synthase
MVQIWGRGSTQAVIRPSTGTGFEGPAEQAASDSSIDNNSGLQKTRGILLRFNVVNDLVTLR